MRPPEHLVLHRAVADLAVDDHAIDQRPKSCFALLAGPGEAGQVNDVLYRALLCRGAELS